MALDLRAYIDSEIAHLHRELELEVQAHADHHKTNNLALALARDIIERRLDILNHFQTRMEALTKDFVPREIHILMESRLRAVENDTANSRGRLWAFGVTLSVGVTLLMFGIQLLLK